jgi:hypothetical protein
MLIFSIPFILLNVWAIFANQNQGITIGFVCLACFFFFIYLWFRIEVKNSFLVLTQEAFYIQELSQITSRKRHYKWASIFGITEGFKWSPIRGIHEWYYIQNRENEKQIVLDHLQNRHHYIISIKSETNEPTEIDLSNYQYDEIPVKYPEVIIADLIQYYWKKKANKSQQRTYGGPKI